MRAEYYLGEGDEASVSEGGDDQSLLTADKLILVEEGHVGDADRGLLLVRLEVEPGLLEPLKVRGGLDVEPKYEHTLCCENELTVDLNNLKLNWSGAGLC